jgi:RsiW-degrading membrane proteinase PrsW (M82 family)
MDYAKSTRTLRFGGGGTVVVSTGAAAGLDVSVGAALVVATVAVTLGAAAFTAGMTVRCMPWLLPRVEAYSRRWQGLALATLATLLWVLVQLPFRLLVSDRLVSFFAVTSLFFLVLWWLWSQTVDRFRPVDAASGHSVP